MNTAGMQLPESSLGLVSLSRFAAYFVKLGTLGFGGPIAPAGHMQKELVEERDCVSRQDYVEGLAFSQLSPGPLAAQLAMYLGWVRAGTLGATLTGAAFVLPSLLMVMVLATLYVHYGRPQARAEMAPESRKWEVIQETVHLACGSLDREDIQKVLILGRGLSAVTPSGFVLPSPRLVEQGRFGATVVET